MIDRQKVYEKFNGHCAYCGKVITVKEMQVDHIVSKRRYGTDDFENLYPACRQCNHYKRAEPLAIFRRMIKTLHGRIHKIYICKVAEDYGIIDVKEWDGKFYFEREEEK